MKQHTLFFRYIALMLALFIPLPLGTAMAAEATTGTAPDEAELALLERVSSLVCYGDETAGFADATSLTADDLLNVYLHCGGPGGGVPELSYADGLYRISPDAVQECADRYFDGCVFFDPAALTSGDYDVASGEILMTAASGFTHVYFAERGPFGFTGADRGAFTVTYYDRYEDPASTEILGAFSIQLVYLDGVWKLTSKVTCEKAVSAADISFSDISDAAWYAPAVSAAVDAGIMKGRGNGLFAPTGTVTGAEAITVALRLAGVEAEQGMGASWYAPLVEAARTAGLLESLSGGESVTDYTAPVTRLQMAELFYRALKGQNYAVVADVQSVPDLTTVDGVDYSDCVLPLYRWGILTGDSSGNFNQSSNLTRAELAQIVYRVLNLFEQESSGTVGTEAAAPPSPPDCAAYSRAMDGTVFNWTGSACGYTIDSENRVVTLQYSGETLTDLPEQLTAADAASTGFYVSDGRTVAAFQPDGENTIMVLTSADRGLTWAEANVAYEGTATWIALSFLDAQTGWMLVCAFVGMGRETHSLFRTADGGESWDVVDGNLNSAAAGMVSGFGFVDGETGFVGFRYESAGEAVVCVTHDAGATWCPLSLPLPDTAADASCTPLSAVPAEGGTVLLPVLLTQADGTEETIYFVSYDLGLTWMLQRGTAE